MKYILTISCFLFFGLTSFAQQQAPQPQKQVMSVDTFHSLPVLVLKFLRDSVDYSDIVFYPPYSNSMSLEGRNASMVSMMIEPVAVKPADLKQTGHISLLVKGREVLFCKLFLAEGDSWVVTEYKGKTYYNRLLKQGADFLKGTLK